MEHLEIRSVKAKEVIMTDKNGFWFPLVMDTKVVDKITGESRIMPRVVKFTSLDQATNWLLKGR